MPLDSCAIARQGLKIMSLLLESCLRTVIDPQLQAEVLRIPDVAPGTITAQRQEPSNLVLGPVGLNGEYR